MIPLLIAKRSRSGMFKVQVTMISISVDLLLTLVWITVEDKSGAEKSVEAFGRDPIGLPLLIFMPLLFLILGSPVPWFIRCAVIETFLQYGILDPGELPEGWERGQAIAKWVVGYLVLLAGIWIADTGFRGI